MLISTFYFFLIFIGYIKIGKKLQEGLFSS